ncbi:hypothetical protein GYMLUDRAFT_61798 [Collybiopsis luxurians FD-317 M1]|uniref:BRCT domain-containing protein n=1 Tax=Collybiopsis luxurians FD-317 M1 TaxID=944289 RepID=A0A0D0BNY0_9AGAR|nr:hypothetical protein GYMLUDRAFT_61798 [Collybiopsis luxurians FD-317 M1]
MSQNLLPAISFPHVPSSNSLPSNSTEATHSNVLKACTLFVDIWMTDREEMSSIFAELARNIGARVCLQPFQCRQIPMYDQVANKVGKHCTHLVSTAGRPKTVQRYLSAVPLFLELSERERPEVVGAAWIKDCRDSAKRLHEDVDMEDYQILLSSTKRKRRFIPKFIGDSDSGVGGTDMNSTDNDIAPLERPISFSIECNPTTFNQNIWTNINHFELIHANNDEAGTLME